MPYATVNDMLLRFGPGEILQLSDIGVPRTGAVDQAVVHRALEDASSWIDGYLVGRYPLPLTVPSAQPALRLHCCNVARYLLMTTAPDEVARALYEDAERYFSAVAKGQINLVAPSEAPPAVGAGAVIFSPGAKIFGRDGAE